MIPVHVNPDVDTPVIEARATRTWVGADGIVRSQIRPGSDFSVEDSADALRGVRALADRSPAPVLVDARGVRTASREARLYWERPEARDALSAMGIVVGSPVSRIIATFFIRLVRPGFLVRIFSSEEDAVAWLREVP
jgi:hypothetical protein